MGCQLMGLQPKASFGLFAAWLATVDCVMIGDNRGHDLQKAIERAGMESQSLDQVADMLSGDVQELNLLLGHTDLGDLELEVAKPTPHDPRASVLLSGREVAAADPDAKEDADAKDPDAKEDGKAKEGQDTAKEKDSKAAGTGEPTMLEKGLTFGGAVTKLVGTSIYSGLLLILITCIFSSCFKRRKDEIPQDQNAEDELHEVWVLSSDSSGKGGRVR